MSERRILPIKSLAEFVGQVSEIRRNWDDGDLWIEPWFRGEPKAGWKLLPNVFRNGETFDLYSEYNFRDDFERRGVQLAGGQRFPTNDREWYFTIQHHRGRTRLLDWTDAALVALYFAVAGKDTNGDRIVWVLDPTWFNNRFHGLDTIVLPSWQEALAYLPKLYSTVELPERPIAIDPPHVTSRFSVQHSHFTMHGSKPLDLRKLVEEPHSRLQPIRISRKYVDEMRRDLRVCGIVETSIYPDFEGLARELSDAYGLG